MGRFMAEGEPTESVALARLACDLDGEHAAACAAIARLLDLADANEGPPPPNRRFPRSAQFVMSAVAVARTPDVALPAPPA
jgi:hypothetical protein